MENNALSHLLEMARLKQNRAQKEREDKSVGLDRLAQQAVEGGDIAQLNAYNLQYAGLQQQALSGYTYVSQTVASGTQNLYNSPYPSTPTPPSLPGYFPMPVRPYEAREESDTRLDRVLKGVEQLLGRIDDLEATVEHLQEQIEELGDEK